MAAVTYLQNAFENKQMPHLSTVMEEMQKTMESIMTKFVRLYANK
jgi:fructose-bisphosphate aldolase class II